MLIDLPTFGSTLAPIGRPLPKGTTRHVIADGIRGTAQTIGMMQNLVAAGKRDNDIRALVGKIINPENKPRPCESKDYICYAKALYEWTRDNILYAYDPHMVEYIEKASIVASNRIGDCDSMDILLCSMFEHIGLQSQFVTIKADPSRPDEYTHVYTRVMIPKLGWVVADPIMPQKWFGWEPPYPNGKKYWPASTDDANSPIDTTDSVVFSGPNSPGQPPEGPFDGVIGMGGLGLIGSMGRGGFRRGGGRGGYYGGGVIVEQVPVPDQVFIIENSDVAPQQVESPMTEENFGVQSFSGIGDVQSVLDGAWNGVLNFVNPIGAAVGLATGLSQTELISWANKVIDGSLAKELTAKRAKANSDSDFAAKALQNAKKSGSASVVSAANAFMDKTRNQQYALNDAIAKYNQASDAIKSASAGYYSPASVGLGSPAVPVSALILVGLVATALYKISAAYQTSAEKFAEVELAKIELCKKSPEACREYTNSASGNSSKPSECSWSSLFSDPSICLKSVQQGAGTSLLNTALIVAGAFVAYKVVDKLFIEGGRDIVRAGAERISRRPQI